MRVAIKMSGRLMDLLTQKCKSKSKHKVKFFFQQLCVTLRCFYMFKTGHGNVKSDRKILSFEFLISDLIGIIIYNFFIIVVN